MASAIVDLPETTASLASCGGLSWAELDLDQALWVLPGARAKNSLSHRVPLSAAALDVIRARPKFCAFVFASSSNRPISAWSEAKAVINASMRAQLGDVPQWQIHDVRRTFATHLSWMGVDQRIISMLLNHRESGVTRLYTRNAHDPERRAAMDAWAERLALIVAGQPVDSVVVPMVAPAARASL